MGRGGRGESGTKRKVAGGCADAAEPDLHPSADAQQRPQQHPPMDGPPQMDDDSDEDVEAEEEEPAPDMQQQHRQRSTRNAIAGAHPRGIKPLGNLLFDGPAGGGNIRGAGLGPWLGGRAFTDESLLDLLKAHCGASELVSLSRCSKALYVFAGEEELWRALTLDRWEGDFRYTRDWKNTYALMARRERWRAQNPAEPAAAAAATANSASAAIASPAAAAAPSLATDPRIPDFALLPTPLKIKGFYSDYLFQAFYCSHIDLLSSYGEEKPLSDAARAAGIVQAPLDNIPRVHARDLTPERFRAEFGAPNRPCIIQGLMDSWPCFAPGEQQWNEANWEKMYGDMHFKIGRYVMPLREYFRYMRSVRSDESPLYLFDSRFGEKVPALLNQYEVPEYFRNDLFTLLENKEKEATRANDDPAAAAAAAKASVRPAFRWILVGPARSGSTWHKDPNHTSAWNGLISGRKKWIMYPPSTPPPGVFPSPDQAEVCTPISVAEWFINHYAEHRTQIDVFEERKKHEEERQKLLAQQQQGEARANKRTKTASSTDSAAASSAAASAAAAASSCAAAAASSSPSSSFLDGPVECICEPGEVIFIPNGWWHTALNLTPSFAVTQNYVNEDNLWNVADFLATDPGERERNLTLLDAFDKALQEHRPELADFLQQKRVEKELADAARAEAEAAAARGKRKGSLWARATAPL